MILTITNVKGGSGKSVITTNLAVCLAHMNYNVIIIDIDKNKSSIRWSELRPDEYPKIETIAFGSAKELRENANSLVEKYDIVLIDGTPDFSDAASTIMLLADFVIIPVKMGVLDIWATQLLVEKYIKTKKLNDKTKLRFLMTQVDARTRMKDQMIEALQSFNIPILNTIIHNRIAYSESVVGGLGSYEYVDNKAKQEMISLANEVLSLMK